MIDTNIPAVNTSQSQPQFRDRLFKAIFGRNTEQSKRWRLDLYNALNNSTYTDPDALELNTIENVIYITMKNDISFLIDSQMTLYEQQSTYNPNMPLRGFFYFSQLYQIYLAKTERTLHTPSLVKIPRPKFVVFYNGKKEFPDRIKLRLSDAFENTEKSESENSTNSSDDAHDFEWTALMININKNHNSTLQKKCKSLYDYVSYVTRVEENKRSGLSAKDSVNEAVDWAVKENLLEGFFKVQKKEILGMILEEYDEDLLRRSLYRDGFAEGTEKGIEKGRKATLAESARSFYENGASIELISKSLHMSEDKVRELVKDVVVNQ